ncbi:hypothetical protein GK047_10955 [Paenibacillus sp. SYP-B3998]|uniref:Uncharacterized protein n=1 Tax=Paenibacillus sp. SYP-B3998 TaxID=2678564 RepID=A0A6G3ZWS7_9BACL|nr:hypothetical protein [Paenibacillus sp. SYP-B3998]NEW06530.1 hypothetical protein [Paenibacillus sp. SYP-B3998]
MKKFVTASLITALSLTMLAGGASAAESNSAKINISSEQVNPLYLGTVYLNVKVGWTGQLDNFSAPLKFYVGNGNGAVSVTTSGFARANFPGQTSIYTIDVNGNVAYIYEITVTQ